MNLDNLFVTSTVNPAQVTLALIFAFVLSFLWATVYHKTHSGIAYTRSFYLSLIMVPPIIAMIMMAIGSNIALSLGLISSLSVIRFRTVIKDTRDMTFLFMAIAIGLTVGAGVWQIGVIGIVVVSIVLGLMSRIGNDWASSSDYILIFRSPEKDPWAMIANGAQELIRWRQLRGATEIDHGREFEYTYNIRLAAAASAESIVAALSNGVIRQVTMIAPENHLDI